MFGLIAEEIKTKRWDERRREESRKSKRAARHCRVEVVKVHTGHFFVKLAFMSAGYVNMGHRHTQTTTTTEQVIQVAGKLLCVCFTKSH